jgi:LacI family transcriptional regulator
MAAITIYDVARRAGVSIKTVSRVLNNESGVKSDTRDRVRDAAHILGYHPSLSARSLAGSRSFVIAAFVDAALTIDHWQGARASDYLTRVQLGATVECRRAGYHFVIELIDRDPPGVEREVQGVLGALRPDGVLLTPPSCDDDAVLELLRSARIPFVRLGSEAPGGGGVRVRMDDVGAASAIVEHLIELGHRRIGIVLGETHYPATAARLRGWREALARYGLAAPEVLIRPGDFTYQSGYAAVGGFLSLPEPPTAIFASSDDMALGVLAALADAGLSAPLDVSVVGFDDSAAARSSNPPLTTVGHPLEELARFGVHALVAGEVSIDEEREVFAPLPFRLAIRRSAGPAAATDQTPGAD